MKRKFLVKDLQKEYERIIREINKSLLSLLKKEIKRRFGK